MSVSKKRTISDKSRIFLEKLFKNYCFVQANQKAKFLICQE